VYCANGYGPKAEIIKRETWGRPFRGVHYTLKIVEDSAVLKAGTILTQRATTLSRVRRSGVQEGKRFGHG
jgi:hypothetical protein